MCFKKNGRSAINIKATRKQSFIGIQLIADGWKSIVIKTLINAFALKNYKHVYKL
jgi:hypothetical protein